MAGCRRLTQTNTNKAMPANNRIRGAYANTQAGGSLRWVSADWFRRCAVCTQSASAYGKPQLWTTCLASAAHLLCNCIVRLWQREDDPVVCTWRLPPRLLLAASSLHNPDTMAPDLFHYQMQSNDIGPDQPL
jgi:hypothetical protein